MRTIILTACLLIGSLATLTASQYPDYVIDSFGEVTGFRHTNEPPAIMRGLFVSEMHRLTITATHADLEYGATRVRTQFKRCTTWQQGETVFFHYYNGAETVLLARNIGALALQFTDANGVAYEPIAFVLVHGG